MGLRPRARFARARSSAKNDPTSAIADHIRATGHNIKWDHFDILASGKTDYHCKIKETLLIQELKPALNVNVSSEKQPRSQVLSPTRRETVVGSGHVSPRIWEITNKRLGVGEDQYEICLYKA